MLLGPAGRMLPRPAHTGTRIAAAVVAAGLLFVPINGLHVWNWIFSYYPNPSLPILGLLIAQRSPRFLGVTFSSRPIGGRRGFSARWWARSSICNR
jgi:hypothetical protein